MNGILRLTVLSCCVAGMAAVASGHPTEPRMFWVGPDGDPTNYASGTTILYAQQGDVIHTELWYQGPDGSVFLSHGVQAFFETTLNPAGGCVPSGQVIADCSSIAIDYSHPDYPGFVTTTVSAPPSECPAIKAGFALFDQAQPSPDRAIPGAPSGAYIGEIDWVVGANACGEFVSYYVGTPNIETMIIDDQNQYVLTAIFDELQINVMPENDLCASATVAAVGTLGTPGVTPYDTTCGCQHGPTPSCSIPGPDVFFEVTATCSGNLLITLTGGGDWALYDDGCALTSEVACNTSPVSVNDGDTFILQIIGDDVVGDLLIGCPQPPCTDTSDCDDLDVCTYDECVDSVCSNTPRLYADVNGNGFPKLFDIFCILDLIAGHPVGPECDPVNADIAGLRGECGPNGVVNVFDIFAILDMIAGVDPCCSPQLTGACCTEGVCTDGVTHANCYYGDGIYTGDGTDCGSVTCP